MTVNGMLILSVPQHSGVEFNKYYSRTYSNCYYHYTPTMLLYMLAVNGFDCRDAYLLKKFQDPWINIAVYKTDQASLDPKTTTWFDLIDKNRVLYKHFESREEVYKEVGAVFETYEI